MRSFVLEPLQPLIQPVASAGRYCPTCGYDQNGAPDHKDSGRCPECGCEWLRKNLLAVQPYGPIITLLVTIAHAWWKVLICAGFAVFLIGMLLPALSHTTCRCYAPHIRAAAALRTIHEGLVVYANEHNNAYPDHATSLLIENYVTLELFKDRRVNTGPINAGTYDLTEFDYTAEDEQALQAAIASDLQQPYYRVGDYWFVPLASPTGNSKLIAGWSLPDADGKRTIVFDDNHTANVSQAEWQLALQADNTARARLNLLSIPPPP